MKRPVFRTLLAAAAVLGLTTVPAAIAAPATKVTVGYQTDALPSSLAIATGEFAKTTGVQIDFRKFNSGADVLAAIASGDVHVGYVGSSPLAAAASRGLDVKAFYLATISGTDEALVVRNGSGIEKPADLKGKRLAAAPVSTDHYQLLATLKHEGIAEKDAKVFAIPQPEIVAAWTRGDLDAAFVWDPALTELKKNGKVLLTSKQVADRGAPTFTAWVARGDFYKENPAFLKSFSAVINRLDRSFVADKTGWSASSENAQALAKLLGGTPADQAAGLQNLSLVDLKSQAGDAWLAGGDKGGVAKILKDTAAFLKEQQKISAVLPSYASVVTAEVVAPLAK